MSSAPVLAFPDQQAEFILDTDASNTGLGAVLSQRVDDQEKVIGYYSRQLSRPERRYCVTRKELLAIVKSLAHFHPYLYGRKFLLRTDHASLRWLVNFKEPEGQLARWLQRLQQYDYVIVHRPGKNHQNADGLSRRPCEPDDCRYCPRQEQKDTDNQVAVNRIVVQGLDLATAQREDDDLGKLWEFKERSDERPLWADVSALSPTFKAYWAEWDSVVVEDGLLYRRWHGDVGNRVKLLPVVPRSMQDLVLQQLHNSPTGGHFGRKKTLEKVKEKYYWIQRQRSVFDWCRNCQVCSTRKGPQRRQHGPAQLYIVGSPMERVAVDILGPLPISNAGNKYLLVAMDYFTKWPEVFAIPDQEAVTIARALVEGMFCRFGAPMELHSDQGRNFESTVMAEVCRLFGISKTRTTAGYPQSDGMVERFNRTLLNALAAFTESHQKDWDEYVPFVLFAYRTACHESTDVSPCRVMLGRELRGPLELILPRPKSEDPTEVTDYAIRLREILEEVHQKVRDHLQSSGSDMKRRYDRQADKNSFRPGDAVWLYNPRVKRNTSPKLARPWEGPYRVMDKLTDVVYRVQQSPRSKPRVVNRYRLWRVQGQLPDDWWETSTSTAPEPGPTEDPSVPEEEEDEDTRLESTSLPGVSDNDDGPGVAQPSHTRRGRPIQRPRRFLV